MKRLIIISLILCGSILYGAEGGFIGVAPLYMGTGARTLGLGLINTSDFGYSDMMWSNPASLALINRLSLSGGAGNFNGENIYLSGGISIPKDYGVLSFKGLFSSDSKLTNGIESIYGVSACFSKNIIEDKGNNWNFGASLDIGYNSIYDLGSPNKSINVGLNLGIIRAVLNDPDGIGIKDLSYGVAVKGIGKPATFDNLSSYPLPSIGLGINFKPIKYTKYSVKFFAATEIGTDFSDYRFDTSMGLEHTLFNLLYLRTGYLLIPNKNSGSGLDKMGPYLIGAGVKIKMGKSDAFIDASYVPYSHTNSKQATSTFYFNFSLAFGYYDDVKPEATTTVKDHYFSPNLDGQKDIMDFGIEITDNKMLWGWRLEILDKTNKVVKTFTYVDKRKIRKLTFKKFSKRIFESKSPVDVPERIVWDGLNQAGNPATDGEYKYQIVAWDENRNTHTSQEGIIYLDTVYPTLAVKETDDIFSPNSDGAKDEFTINVDSQMEKDDTATLRILSDSGKSMKDITYKGKIPEKISWDGKTKDKKKASEGNYRIEIKIIDLSGNVTTKESLPFRLVRKYETIKVKSSTIHFSPNGDGYNDNIKFDLTPSSTEGLEKWEFNITDQKSNVIYSIKGEKEMPDNIIWDGIGDNGKKIEEGDYYYKVNFYFHSGNHPVSKVKPFSVDVTPPKVELKPSYLAFSPNNDGDKDDVDIRMKLSNRGKGDEFKGKILSYDGKTVKTYDWDKKLPPKITWDGKDDEGKTAKDGKYRLLVETKDIYGNRASYKSSMIKLRAAIDIPIIESTLSHISPNKDGNKDKLDFLADAEDPANIVGWTVDVLDEKDSRVRKLSGKGLYPQKITFNGKNDSNEVLPDGKYQYYLTVNYTDGNKPESMKSSFIIDTKKPGINIKLQYKVFSPNGDGRKDSLLIELEGERNSGDLYIFQIKKGKKNIDEISWDENIPESMIWDGKNTTKKEVPEGEYKLILSAEDIAGNKSKIEKEVDLVRKIETISINLSEKAISPNKDDKLDNVTLTPSFSSKKYLQEWGIDIKDSQGKVINSFKFNPDEEEFIWDGKDKNKKVPEGKFKVSMWADYKSGNHPAGEVQNISIDITSPVMYVNVTPKIFSPDDDGENDTLYINLKVSDISRVDEWKAFVYLRSEKYKEPFKTFSGKGKVDEVIEWDGKSDLKDVNGNPLLVDSAQDFYIVLESNDTLGNSGKSEPADFYVDILVIKTPFGYKIRISNIEFDYDKWNIKESSEKLLERLAQILYKFDLYDVKVVGHTDSKGSEKYNMDLSLKRAQSVMEWLIENDIKEEILSKEGKGESEPVSLNENEDGSENPEGMSRNRRVEFYLIK